MDNQTINRTILLKKGKQDKKRTAGYTTTIQYTTFKNRKQ